MSIRGYAEDAVCPKCGTYTLQRIVRRGVRLCDCGTEFKLSDTDTLRSRRKERERIMLTLMVEDTKE